MPASTSLDAESATPPLLAASCSGCGQPRENENVATFMRSDVKSLELNRDAGCLTCALILEGIDKCLSEVLVSEIQTLRLEYNGTGIRSFELTVDGDDTKRISFFVSPGTYNVHPGLQSMPIGHEVPEATSSAESIDWARSKLEECIGSHPGCTQNLFTVLPHRVLDIGESPGDQIRVKEPGGELGRYICLSHCWGTEAFLCTLSTNIDTHKDSIPLERLPATFRDAVYFTRVLGVRYLWIDSLCIIQDDPDDWRIQAGTMADIYANAFLTIAAVHADGARRGLFSTSNPESHSHLLSPRQTIPLPVGANNGSKPEVYARRAISHIDSRYIGTLAMSSPSGKDLPLLHRAWFFQERLLSQRVLYLTSAELSWQCSACTACQCRDDDRAFQIDLTTKVRNPREYYHASALHAALEERGKEEVARRWLDLIASYSMLDMTFEKDIFPAVSGLARGFGGLLGAEYVAGLWNGFILPGLLWHPIDGRRKKWGGRPCQWRAPTWSWASAETTLSFIHVSRLLHPCEVIRTDHCLLGPDPMGEITSGELVVRGQVFTAKLTHKVVTGELHPWNVFTLDFMKGMMGNLFADYDITLDSPGKIENNSLVRCLFVGMHADLESCYALVLKERPAKSLDRQPKFERIGLAEVFKQKTKLISRVDGATRMLSGYEIIRERSSEETIVLV